MKVAILCASRRSIYKTFNDVEVFDKLRDARTFDGSIPVVAHPPCRAWSAFCRHQAKPEDGEKELGPLCVDFLIRCGGVLEHPAYSRLFEECDLPNPGERRGGLWTTEVLQSWWGRSTTQKRTWLCISRVDPGSIEFPFSLGNLRKGDKRRWQLLSKVQRSATSPEFGQWLVDVARKVT